MLSYDYNIYLTLQLIRQEDNALFRALVSRSVYEDEDSCTELIVCSYEANSCLMFRWTIRLDWPCTTTSRLRTRCLLVVRSYISL